MGSWIAYAKDNLARTLLDSAFFAVLLWLAAIALILISLSGLRLWWILPQRDHAVGRKRTEDSRKDTCTVALLLGSGESALFSP